MKAIDVLDKLEYNEEIHCTLEEYDPPLGIGVRGLLAIYAINRVRAVDWSRANRAFDEIKRLDVELQWKEGDTE